MSVCLHLRARTCAALVKMSTSGASVFQTLQKDFISLIDLGTLVPELNARRLLTSDEEYLLLNENTPPRKRITYLTRILRAKGCSTPELVLECLEAEKQHLGHAELSKILKRQLGEESGSHGRADVVTPPDLALSNPRDSMLLENSPEIGLVDSSGGNDAHATLQIPASQHEVHVVTDLVCADVELDSQSPHSRLCMGAPQSTSLEAASPLLGSYMEATHSNISSEVPPSTFNPMELSTVEQSTGRKHFLEREVQDSASSSLISTPVPKRRKLSKNHRQPPTLPPLRPRERDAEQDPLVVLIDTVKATYKNKKFYHSSTGPNIGRLQFIKLALIHKQRAIESIKQRSKFLRDSLHGLVEDIENKKESIKVEAIFNYGRADERKLILVEGAPGVGKTMLAKKLCIDWANGKCLKEYDLVILVTLRCYQDNSELDVKHIVSSYLGSNDIAIKAALAIVKCLGDKVLFIFEGWDELSPNLRKDFTFFVEVVKASKLPKASVMVTSRPTVTGMLQNYMDERRIEVLGFSPKQVEKFVQQHSEGDTTTMLLRHLKQFPNLRALAHIPLTLCIICKVAQLRDCGTLPQTLTELYKCYIYHVLYESHNRTGSISCVSSIEDLPSCSRRIFYNLCKLALKGFEDRQFVFKAEDLEEHKLELSEGFDGFGLLSTFQEKVVAGAGRDLLYQFRHLSIQEYMAAQEITGLLPAEQMSLVRKYRKDKQFQNIWKFLAGISQLQNEKLRDIIINETDPRSTIDQLFLLHCMYEANKSETSEAAAGRLDRKLTLDNMSLNTTDCLCLAHMITSAKGEWHIDLRACNIGEDGLEVLKTHIIANASPELKIVALHLRHNHLDVKAITHFAEILSNSVVHVRDINLGTNKFGDEGAKIIATALEGNTTVKFLHMSFCNLTHYGAKVFADMLRKNKSLKNLFIGFEAIGDEGVCHLASVLRDNSSLTELSLTKTGLGSQGLRALAKMLEVNKTLEVLRLDRNPQISNECKVVAEMIMSAKALRLIDLSKNKIGDEGFGLVVHALTEKPDCLLKKLGVFDCGITSEGIKKLVPFFETTQSFEGLTLGNNRIGDEGARHLASALSKNKSRSIKEVLLEGTGITEEGRQHLADACKPFETCPVNYDFHGHLIKVKELSVAT